MVKKNIVSNEKKVSKHINLHSSFKCPTTAFKKCKNYDGHDKLESRCKTDSTVGYCITELEVIRWIDNYLKEYDQSEVINGLGDIR